MSDKLKKPIKSSCNQPKKKQSEKSEKRTNSFLDYKSKKTTTISTHHHIQKDTIQSADHLANNVTDLVKTNCRVSLSQLKRHTDPQTLPESTDLVPELPIGFGQPRAIQALETAFDIKASGYHVFAVGENGLGKRTFITNYLKKLGKTQAVLSDWVYVHNFSNPLFPLAISVKKSTAPALAECMLSIWKALTQCLKTQLQNAHSLHYSSALSNLKPKTIPQTHTQTEIAELQATAKHTLLPLFETLIKSHSNNQKLKNHLNTVMNHMLHNAYDIAIQYANIANNPYTNKTYTSATENLNSIPAEYSITVISDFSKVCESSHNFAKSPRYASKTNFSTTADGAPIVFADTPNQSNLLGHIEYATRSGSVVTDVSMIRSGALHQANGGYLLIEANRLIKNPDAWHDLKRALQLKQIQFVKPQMSSAASVSLMPEPIPLNIKVILLGDLDLYDKFIELDDEFDAVFKIRADFHDQVERTLDNELAMVSKMADIIKKHDLLAFHCSAQAEVLDNLSLQIEDQNKLSLHIDRLTQLMLEADRHAVQQQSQHVQSIHVEHALTDIQYRSSYLKELYWQELTDGQQLISTSGKAIGQINALTVIEYADIEFGMPARLTAVVQHSMGSGDILDIERDVELGGSLHAKGMLIMNSYLRALFSPFHPLNFTASLAFEQSYAHIDGDSATLAEACALLSALADVPISQSLAITGSMNQLGMVQAVGGVTAKVNGFFDVCCHQGLTGDQGIILPVANISQLMLRDDIIEAVNSNQFHIYAVRTLSEALTILSEMPIDAVTKKGRYRKSSLFGKVIKNLKKWDEQLNPAEEAVLPTTDTSLSKSKH